MKNLWPDAFEENDKPTAKSALEEQAKLLPKITNGIVFAEIVEMSDLDATSHSMINDFSFRFNILGKFLEGYRFRVLSFSHDITLYPVKFLIDSGIGSEIGIKPDIIMKHTTVVNDPTELENLLTSILSSQRIKDIVGSILRLSK
ncbi:MAG: hypothetical protein AB2799_14775 [Candidatus Thiodiazotropha sp.]